MPLSTAELEQLLSLSLAALRAVQASPAAAAAVQSAPIAAVQSVQPAAALTLSEWLVTFRQIVADRKYNAQTIKNRTANLKHVAELWGALPIAQLKPRDIVIGLKSVSPSTAARVLGELRDVYCEAIANGVAEANPASLVKAPPHPGLRERLTFETWSAMRALSRTSPQRWVEAMLLLAMVTGQRRSDLVAMRFSDIVTDDLGRQYLRVEQAKKAGKPIGARVEIPLALRMDAIGMSVGDVVEHCRAAGRPGPNLLRTAGGAAIEMSSLSARFHAHILTVCGADAYEQFAWPSLHEVRSLCARTYLAQGYTREQIQTLLGHSHAEMTDLYLNDRGLSAGTWRRVELQAC